VRLEQQDTVGGGFKSPLRTLKGEKNLVTSQSCAEAHDVVAIKKNIYKSCMAHVSFLRL
jgi:hypothetical protein